VCDLATREIKSVAMGNFSFLNNFGDYTRLMSFMVEENRSCNIGRRCDYTQLITAETTTRALESLLMLPDYTKVFGFNSVPFR